MGVSKVIYVIGSLSLYFGSVRGLHSDLTRLTVDFFTHKGVKNVCYLSCESQYKNQQLTRKYMQLGLRASVKLIDGHQNTSSGLDLEVFLYQSNAPVGVLLDATCDQAQLALDEASDDYVRLFDAMHVWMVITRIEEENDTNAFIDEKFAHLNLSVDADITVIVRQDAQYRLIDVFNFGKIQGSTLRTELKGTWNNETGLQILLDGFKYYHRWDFHNLTLRGVTVVLNSPKVFDESVLTDVRYTPDGGVSVMTKIAGILLDVLKHEHNFSFNITVTGLWIGAPQRNSTLAVTNTLFWREQDISYTSCRIFPQWLQWMDPFLAPVTKLETKFFYRIPNPSVGSYENRFLSPLSGGVWACAIAAGVASALTLALASTAERRPRAAEYAFFSVLAATCQQAYEDGVQLLDEATSTGGRRMALLVLGLTSMLMYNYYTSSVVSWLLSASAPTLSTLDGLINSDLELVFEDIGYTWGWLNNPGFFYYSGFKNPKEDILREKKITKRTRTVPLMQSAKDGIELIRTGAYAYHSEPYTASQEIGRLFDDRELCELGALQMMIPSHAYVMGQKRSPYKQFFVWSLMRVFERGHTRLWQSRVVGTVPACGGQSPRALALGQAAPAFAVLAVCAVLAAVVLAAEILHHRYMQRSKKRVIFCSQKQKRRKLFPSMENIQ